jgi:hypothetical protein
MNTGQTITIPVKEYENMVERLNWLDCLEAAGVDNWQGIDEAINIRDEEE